ncbi:MAG: SdrD B-like domain-containing protein [Halioglobus sp.]
MRRTTIALSALLYLSLVQQTQAAACLENSSPGKICTANDFETVSEELVTGPASCVDGEIIPGDVVIRIGLLGNRTSTYDIGFFIGDADNSPINGESCTFDSLDRIEPGDGAFNGLSGNGPYRNLDSNSCGDADKDDGAIYKDITLNNVLCQDSNNDGNLDVAYAITWKQNTGACDDPTNPDNFGLATTSKCINNIGDIGEIPVLPPNPDIPSIRVEKIAEPLVISPGESVDYTINVVNDGPVLVTLDSLVDDRFGDLDGQGSCQVPQKIAPEQIYTCSFNAAPTGGVGSLHINIVTGSGTGDGQPVTDDGRAIVDIVDPAEGAIGYLVWNDLDADGIKQENEQGIEGATVFLYEERIPSPVQTTTTNEDGAYAFRGLTGGIYLVLVEEAEPGPLSNLVRTTAANPINVSLAPGEVFTFANFGYVRAEIQVAKTPDPQVVFAPGGPVNYTVEVKNSGVVAVELTDLADDKFGNLFDEGDCIAPATPLEPGDVYSCLFTQQINGAAGDTHTNTVQAAAQDQVEGYQVYGADDAKVAILDPANGSIGDLVWLDINANGQLDEGEGGLDDVTLELSFDSNNDGSYETVISTDTTVNSGQYGFIGLSAGSYRVTVTDSNKILQDRFLTTPPEPRDIILSVGAVDNTADFGYANIPKPKIRVVKIPSDFIVESPSADVTYNIFVFNIGDTVVTIDQLIDSRFGELDGKGTCVVGERLTQRQVYRCRFTETITGEPRDIHRNRVTAIASDAIDNIAFDSGPAAVLFIAPDDAAIGDQVWEDLNADGVFDAGEPGLGNVSIDLYSGDVLEGSTTTDASGKYVFSGLAAGNFQVRVTDTANVLAGRVLTGGTEPVDVSLAVSEIYADADFGYASAAIEVVKQGNRVVLLEPDGNVTYTITTRNIGYLNVTLTSLLDDRFGDLAGQGSCSLPVAIPARSSVACEFTRAISGAQGDTHTNTVTAGAVDGENNPLEARDYFTVTFVGINFGASGYLVWDDENGNGLRESSEPGIAGVSLNLELDEDNNGSFERLAASAVTSANGYYAFIPVPTGNWRIRVTDSYGVLEGKTLTGGTNPNSFSLDAGQIYRDANFGYFYDDGVPPIDPPPIDPPEVTVEDIPTTPSWVLWCLILGALGLGLYEHRRRERITR